MLKQFILAALLLVTFTAQAQAHFGMVIPSRQMVDNQKDAAIEVELKFWHPFENRGMDLVKPKGFSVFVDGKETDLLGSLQKQGTDGSGFWKAAYKIARPGLYVFAMAPEPYWEETEDCFIQHYTKAVVAAYGQEDGWDKPVGIPAEIVPLSKPYGLYTGNVFQGQVLLMGEPVPHAEVEVEWYPGPGLAGETYSDMMVTQTIKADANGVFTYAAPCAGWWGFAALMEAPYKIVRNDEKKDVEFGAVIWVQFLDMKQPVKLK